jgi:predicted enzyme related to lactoylglutathione lyase
MSTCRIDHIAIMVSDFEWYRFLFETVFEMKVRKTTGEIPSRQLWFEEGIQMIECAEVSTEKSSVDHISFAVEDISTALGRALNNQCTICAKGTTGSLFRME